MWFHNVLSYLLCIEKCMIEENLKDMQEYIWTIYVQEEILV